MRKRLDELKKYLKDLGPEALVALLIDIHGADASEYLIILSAIAGTDAGMVEGRR